MKTKTGGRKAGTPNKATQAIREQIRAADPIGFLIEAVSRGRVPKLGEDGKPIEGKYETVPAIARINAAVKLANKLTPDAKERAIRFEVGRLSGIKDAQIALSNVVKGLGAGEITPSEASSICGIIQHYIKAFEVGELAEQLTAIETQLKAKGVLT